jgi:hypothetical protein
MTKIFVAGPYNHPDPLVMSERLHKITGRCASLFIEGMSPISPLLVGLNMARHANLPTDTDTWRVFSETLLKGCDELQVLMLEGWKDSKGVGYEIAAAERMGIPVCYVDPIENKKVILKK